MTTKERAVEVIFKFLDNNGFSFTPVVENYSKEHSKDICGGLADALISAGLIKEKLDEVKIIERLKSDVFEQLKGKALLGQKLDGYYELWQMVAKSIKQAYEKGTLF